MARLQAVYYRAPDGSEPVNDFIDGLTVIWLSNATCRLLSGAW